jgi:hypothetical protein
VTVLARREADRPAAGKSFAPRRGRRRARLLLAGAGLLAGAAGGSIWAATEGTSAFRAAQRAQGDLLAFQAAVQAQDPTAARRHLTDAERDLDHAHAAARPARWAQRLPWLGRTPRDTSHLLDSARALAAAGDDVLRLQAGLDGADLVAGGRLDMARIRGLQPVVASMRRHVEQADADLGAVRGDGVYGDRIRPLRDEARTRLSTALGSARLADQGLQALGTAVGQPRLYLLTTLNYAELHGGGGAPLSIATVEVDAGGFRVVSRGQVSDFLTADELVPFVAHPDDPWQRHIHRQRFVNANLSPDFAIDGEEMLRLYEGHFGTRPDGVIAVDPTAMAAVLRLTGPVSAPGVGTVDADNLVRKLLVDSYRRASSDWRAIVRRHQENDTLMDALFARIQQVSPSLDQLKGLLGTAREGHLRVYSRDPLVQDVLRRIGVAGELDPFTGDQVGVYTFNLNASKVDVWQRRSVDQQVTMRPDGSAAIVRTITVHNDIRQACPEDDPGNGYETCVSTPYVMVAFPLQAHSVTMTAEDPGRQPEDGARIDHRLNEAGRQVWRARLYLEAGETAKVVLHYSLGPTLLPDGYRLRWDGQPIARDPSLHVSVRPARGVPLRGTGWAERDGRLVRDLRLVGSGDLYLAR